MKLERPYKNGNEEMKSTGGDELLASAGPPTPSHLTAALQRVHRELGPYIESKHHSHLKPHGSHTLQSF